MKQISLKVNGCADCPFKDYHVSHNARYLGKWHCEHDDFKGEDSYICDSETPVPFEALKDCPLPDVE